METKLENYALYGLYWYSAISFIGGAYGAIFPVVYFAIKYYNDTIKYDWDSNYDY